jgi:hypothetical protein
VLDKNNFNMPEISRFFGIIIFMYWDDHNPPHFHARYNEFEAQIIIANGNVLEGDLPTRQLRFVQAWAELHREELDANWNDLAKNPPSFKKIEPLR